MDESFKPKYTPPTKDELSSTFINSAGKQLEKVTKERYEECLKKLETEASLFKYVTSDLKDTSQLHLIKLNEVQAVINLFRKTFDEIQTEAEEVFNTPMNEISEEVSIKARELDLKSRILRARANELDSFAEKLNGFESIEIFNNTGATKTAFDLVRVTSLSMAIDYESYKKIQDKLVIIGNKFPEKVKEKSNEELKTLASGDES
jgi:hypothetical protein